MKLATVVLFLITAYFSLKWSWIILLVVLGIATFITWFQAFVWKKRIQQNGYNRRW